MKYKVIAILLALTIVAWAQSANTSQPPATDQKSENVDKKAIPCCCEKMSGEHKEAKSCMRDGSKNCCSGKHAASCCKDKEAKACMKGGETFSCCSEGKCGDGEKMSCCSAKKVQKAESCCQGMQCGKSAHTHQAG